MKNSKQQKSLKHVIGPRVWGVLFIIAGSLALSLDTGSAQVVPEIDNALSCGRLGEVT